MKEYHKIVTAWERDPATNHKTLIEGAWARPEFAYLAEAEWLWTEKVDGTNIRVMWDGETVRFGGKTDRAQIPTPLLARLQDLFPAERLAAVFGLNGNREAGVCLYGEGYGAGIQKVGKRYKADGSDFILFDVRVGDLWLERPNVLEISTEFGIFDAPARAAGSLRAAIENLRDCVKRDDVPTTSVHGAERTLPIEGYVLRPRVELLDRQGKRIITKIKCKDFRR